MIRHQRPVPPPPPPPVPAQAAASPQPGRVQQAAHSGTGGPVLPQPQAPPVQALASVVPPVPASRPKFRRPSFRRPRVHQSRHKRPVFLQFPASRPRLRRPQFRRTQFRRSRVHQSRLNRPLFLQLLASRPRLSRPRVHQSRHKRPVFLQFLASRPRVVSRRNVPWEFMTVVRSNNLLPYTGRAVDGDRLLNRMYARGSKTVYIRKRLQNDEPPEPEENPHEQSHMDTTDPSKFIGDPSVSSTSRSGNNESMEDSLEVSILEEMEVDEQQVPRTYKVVEGATKKGKPQLVDNMGYRFGVQRNP
uniref:Uncharacterized protein n=1 Tax=Branchiostoma floridae TaxID=7739 RepID=C3ZZH2_BRAFL|eukprot:XP_002586044.1 hypothetical protein BRAFLDRAFT_110116 [Branchiostoma floridae]